MTQPQPEICFVKSDWDSIPGLQRFSHEAMATTFEVIILHEDARYAQQAAWAAFNELDRLEAELSRFIENSDISRINNLAPKGSLRVGLDAFECLKLGARIYAETNGAFDITIGSLLGCWLGEDEKARTPSKEQLNLARQRTGIHLFELDEAEHTVQVLAPAILLAPLLLAKQNGGLRKSEAAGVQIDLGGIGKGYAVDRMVELLRDWSIDTAVIHGGYSSVLAMDAPSGRKGWPLTLSNPDNRKQTLAGLHLQGRALSGSGLQQGRHIIDPRTAQPVEGKRAAWACAPDAATADALSTAFMVMTPDEVKKYCSNHPDILAMIVLEERGEEAQKERIVHFGPWKNSEPPARLSG